MARSQPQLAAMLATVRRVGTEAALELGDAYADAVVAFWDEVATFPDAAFMLTVYRSNRERGAERVREVMQLAGEIDFERMPATRLAKLARRRDVVAGARAALAVSEPFDPYYRRYCPVLAADAAPASLALIDRALRSSPRTLGSGLDWFNAQIVPLLRRSPKGKRLVAKVERLLDAREASSPALVWARELGMRPVPEQLRFTLRLYGPPPLSRLICELRCDSTKARWSVYRVSAVGGFVVVDPRRVARMLRGNRRARYTLSIRSKGSAPDKLHAWAKTLLTR